MVFVIFWRNRILSKNHVLKSWFGITFSHYFAIFLWIRIQFNVFKQKVLRFHVKMIHFKQNLMKYWHSWMESWKHDLESQNGIIFWNHNSENMIWSDNCSILQYFACNKTWFNWYQSFKVENFINYNIFNRRNHFFQNMICCKIWFRQK